MTGPPLDPGSGSIALVRGFLDERGVAYELIEHEERFTAAAEARASGIEPHDAAKDVVLKHGASYVLAVLPASERLDLHKARDLLGAEDLQLASEDEIAADFSRFEVGALPPFGSLHDVAQIVDRRLLDHAQVLCSGGDHRHSLKVDPHEIVRVGDARVGDFCKEE